MHFSQKAKKGWSDLKEIFFSRVRVLQCGLLMKQVDKLFSNRVVRDEISN